jgi:hypothetical protein
VLITILCTELIIAEDQPMAPFQTTLTSGCRQDQQGSCCIAKGLPCHTRSGMHQHACTCHVPRSVACHAVLARCAQSSEADLVAPCMLDISLPAHTSCRSVRNGTSAVSMPLPAGSAANGCVLEVVSGAH